MSCIITTYCISNTGNPLLNDTYLSGGTHNGEPYYSGETNGYVIYYTTSNQWCLSDVLDGTCILSGKFPCTTICPDINDEYLSEGVCPTTTTTTTIDCSILDFEAIFDCEPTPTPSSTPIQTPTPTPTQTSIPPDPCSGTSVVATIELIPSSPTPTPSSTPPPTPTIDRPCVFSGDVTFNTIEGKIICPYSFEFQDCFNGATYLTTNSIFIPTGGTISQFMVFQANVNGDSKCISYVGINLTEIGGDSIEITEGPYGFSNLNGCALCTKIPSPTPTPSVTPTLTPSVTPTPTSTPVSDSLFYVYRECVSDTQKPRWVVQTQVGATTTPGKVQIDDVGTCWEYQYSSNSYPSLPPSSIINYTGNYFTVSTVYSNCDECGVVVVDEQTEINIFFDNSGSMNATLSPLNIMKNTILKPCLLPFYNNDSNLYDQRVKVINMSQHIVPPMIGINCFERGFRCLATTGTTTNITKVINLVFQDEAHDVYYNIFVPSWTNTTQRRPGFDLDMGYLRNTLINQSTPNYLKGIFFRVKSPGAQSSTLKALIVAVRDGNGNYSGTNGLSDRNEIAYELDVIASSTPQYYANVIVNSLNSLGYIIPQC